MRPLAQFQPKISATNLPKVLNFVLLENPFSDLFTEVQIRYRKTFKFASGRFFHKDKVNSSQNMTVFNNWSC